MTVEERARYAEHIERVIREEREEAEAQLHLQLHGNDDRDSCVECAMHFLDAQIARAQA